MHLSYQNYLPEDTLVPQCFHLSLVLNICLNQTTFCWIEKTKIFLLLISMQMFNNLKLNFAKKISFVCFRFPWLNNNCKILNFMVVCVIPHQSCNKFCDFFVLSWMIHCKKNKVKIFSIVRVISQHKQKDLSNFLKITYQKEIQPFVLYVS